MFQDNYKDIFEKRGKEYDLAMHKCKNARDEEFKSILEITPLKEKDKIVDIPAGGCYLSWYLPKNVVYIPVETTQTFSKLCKKNINKTPILVKNIWELPIKSQSIDKVISLAGIHHLMDSEKERFYKEAYRILKKGGIFALADVFEGTKTSKFLNEFVDSYNPMGHKGIFLDKKTTEILSKIGFKIEKSEIKNYFWKFNTEKEMLNFVKLLFGVFDADEKTLLKGIKDYLGYLVEEDNVLFNWQLFFVKAVK
jgi:SAM-dependent methyltransferase